MNSNTLQAGNSSITEAAQDTPAVSIIMPFEPMMTAKAELELRLQRAAERAEAELLANYSFEKVIAVIVKLKSLLQHVSYHNNKKSIAIFVAPLTEEVYYLDVDVEEIVVVDDSFEIRDLVCQKKQDVQYLVMLLGERSSSIYVGNCSCLRLIKANVAENSPAYRNAIAESAGTCRDPVNKENLREKFLRHMDQGLTYVFHVFNLPVFIIGPEDVLEHFKKISDNTEKFAAFIQGDHADSSEPEMMKVLRPYLKNWKKIKEQTVLQEVAAAEKMGKLVTGIERVYATAMQNNSRLLVVERDFFYPSHLLINKDDVYQLSAISVSFYIKDVVDSVIERVLKYGGDVEFVDELKGHDQIALIKYH